MNEIEIKEKFELLIPADKVEMLKQFEEMKARVKVFEDEVKTAAEQFLTEIGKDEYEQGDIVLKRSKDYERTTVDTQRLKEEGLYELYTKKTTVKGGVKISYKYGD